MSNRARTLAEHPVFELFIKLVIIVPLIETLVFQFVLIKGARLFYKNNKAAVLVSALAFGLAHYLNFIVQLEMFIVGLLLATAFVLVEKRKQYPLLVVALIHALCNFYTIMHNMYLKNL